MPSKTVTCSVYRSDETKVVPVEQLIFRPSVYALILNGGRPGDESSARLLTIRLPSGQLYLPGGGVELGETLTEALIREVQEESAMACLPNGQPVWVDEQFFWIDGQAWHIHAFFFEAWLAAGQDPEALAAIEPEVEGVPGWVPLCQLDTRQIRSFARPAVENFLVLKARRTQPDGWIA